MPGRDPVAREHRIAREIYGTVLFLTLLVVLDEDQTSPGDAIGILLSTGVVFWLAHTYAYAVPRIATAGRIHPNVLRTAREEMGVLAAVVVPVVPLSLAALQVVSEEVGFVAAFWLSFAAMGVYIVREGRIAGLTWGRTLRIAAVLLTAGLLLLLLELAIH